MSIATQKFAGLPRSYLLQEMENYVVDVLSIGIIFVRNVVNIGRFIQKMK
jgi:hypothetical protein